MPSKHKSQFGQFYTTNVNHILQGFENTVAGKDVVDPFAGQGDLLKWAGKNGCKSTIGYDIDPVCVKDDIRLNDSLLSIPQGQFLLTNPPYLAKNKMDIVNKCKYLKDSQIEDFYLLALDRVLAANYQEGIIIVPVNFFSSEVADHIRSRFLATYDITKINYFTEQVFDDTTYNVVAFHFQYQPGKERCLRFRCFPEMQHYDFQVQQQFSFRIGGEELSKITSVKRTLKIKRLTTEMISNTGTHQLDGYFCDYNTQFSIRVNAEMKRRITNNIIVLNCIDNKSEDSKISAIDIRFFRKKFLLGKNTSRNIAHILIENVPVEKQAQLIMAFNQKLNELRVKYGSLFLTNFRDNNRKRISFEFCYQLLDYCYQHLC